LSDAKNNERSNENPSLSDVLMRHLEPTVDMLQDAIRICPEDIWNAQSETRPVWEYVYHTVFWLNGWLRDWSTPFEPPSFHAEEALDLGPVVNTVISKDQMMTYLEKVRNDYRSLVVGETNETLLRETEQYGKLWSVTDRVFAQVRHIQHHTAYISAVLREKADLSLDWEWYSYRE
jgi:hypothetical protein